jgi:hypothetical protein
MRTAVLHVTLVFSSVGATAANLTVGDTQYSPACEARSWHQSEARLRRVAAARSPASLVALTSTYVCGNGPAARKALSRAAPRRVLWVRAGTGEETTKDLVEATSLQPHRGRAWDVAVESDFPDVIVSFLVDEACAHSAKFRLLGSGWILVEMQDARD